MVNKNFFATINGLVSQATNGTAPEVVDYNSFIEAGKTITSLQGSDFQNNFIGALMNKIALSINTARSYTGKYGSLTRGSLQFGDTIEMIMNGFYEAQAAAFVDLPNDGSSVDMYEVKKPTAFVDYYVDSNAYQICVTIQTSQLEKAFESPSAMDAFTRGIITYLMNSNELKREAGRIALVANLIVKLSTQSAAATPDSPAMRYPLVTLYNDITGAELTAENCLFNEEFVKFAAQTIKKVMGKTSNVSESYNIKGIKTFTPAENRHLFVSSQLTAALETYIYTNNYNPQYSMLTNYIEVPYFQNEDTPLVVKYKSAEGEDELTSAPVIAVMCDEYAIGEYLRKQSTYTTPFNAKGEYWNTYLNVELKLVSNEYANSVLFTLE